MKTKAVRESLFSGTGTPACALFITPQSFRSWLAHELALNNRKRQAEAHATQT
jgi:hypothetical protein